MTVANIILDNFDDAEGASAGAATAAVREEELRAAAYDEGFAAGERHGKAEQEAENIFFREVGEQLTNAADNFEREASAQICQSLSVLLQAAFPRLSEAGLADEVAAMIREATENGNRPSLVVSAPEARCDALKDALAAQGVEDVAIVAAEDDSARVSAEWHDAGVDIDIEKACDDIVAILERVTQRLRTEQSHG